MVKRNSILVLGAGELGTAVLSALAVHPKRGLTDVAILLRPFSTSNFAKEAQISHWRSLGISILEGDIANANEIDLTVLFSPFQTVICCTGMTYPAGTQLKLARAVIASSVSRYIPWQFGLDYEIIGRGSSQDLFSEQLDVRDLLRQQSALEWVIISTGLFLSFLFEPAFGVVSADYNTVRALGGCENKVTVTDVGDIAKVVAVIAWEAPEVNGVVFTAGETLSYGRLATIVGKIMGREVQREEWSVEKLREELVQDQENGMMKYRVVFAEGRGVSWDDKDTFNAKRGIPVKTVEEWAWENSRGECRRAAEPKS